MSQPDVPRHNKDSSILRFFNGPTNPFDEQYRMLQVQRVLSVLPFLGTGRAGLTRRAIAGLTDLSPSEVGNYLQTLRRQKSVTYRPAGDGHHYFRLV